MAIDEALLHAAPRLEAPVWRFYSWQEKAASFGYFQRYAHVEELTHLRPLVRRPTGGGLVPHEADWTYSLVIPKGHRWYELSAVESYRKVHEWIKAAFKKTGIPTELAPAAHRAGPGQCFVGYERSDVLWNGLKIAGAAQRRTRDGLLIQGSVQPGLIKLERKDFEGAVISLGREFLQCQKKTFELDDPLLEEVRRLLERKYSDEGYHRKR